MIEPADTRPDERSRILAAAEELIIERGLDSVGAAEIAERAGLDEALVEATVGSTDELIAAAVQWDDLRVERDITARFDQLPRASDKLVALIEGCVTAGEHDWTLWIELYSRALRSPVAAEARQRLDDRFRSLIARIIAEGQASGEFEAGDPDRLAVTISTLIDSFAVMATLGDSTVSPNYMLEACGGAAGAMLGADLRGRFGRGREAGGA